METLREKGFACVAPDLRGHGYSDNRKEQGLYTFENLTRDIGLVLAAENIRSAHLVGYSLGGYLALKYAAEHPDTVRSLTLVSASYHALYPASAFAMQALRFLARLFRLQRRKEFRYFEHRAATGYWQSTFQGLFTMPITVNFWMLIEILRFNGRPLLPRISSPALIVYDKGDFYSSPAQFENMRREMPRAQMIELDQSTHFLGSQGQRYFAEEMIAFLKEHS